MARPDPEPIRDYILQKLREQGITNFNVIVRFPPPFNDREPYGRVMLELNTLPEYAHTMQFDAYTPPIEFTAQHGSWWVAAQLWARVEAEMRHLHSKVMLWRHIHEEPNEPRRDESR